MYVHTYIHTYIHTYTYSYTCTHTYIHIHIHIHMHIHMNTHIQVYIHIYMYMHMNTHIWQTTKEVKIPEGASVVIVNSNKKHQLAGLDSEYNSRRAQCEEVRVCACMCARPRACACVRRRGIAGECHLEAPGRLQQKARAFCVPRWVACVCLVGGTRGGWRLCDIGAADCRVGV
jgi:hypothetical protein